MLKSHFIGGNMDFLKRLEKLMTRLRSPGGCPWDRRQTHQSLKPYLLEEAHEVLDAIDSKDSPSLQEELGDLLLQVVFHSQLAKEKGLFNLQDVAKGIGDKLIRRHPHVFSKGSSRRIADINQKWEELKRLEKPDRKSALDGLPRSLPALLRAQRMQEKASKGVRQNPGRIQKETEASWKALQKSLKTNNKSAQGKAAGEFLLNFARLSQVQGLHAEMELQSSAAKYEKKFRAQEAKPS
jgi:tetrapyrrole methylase family protein/MazG family protein